MTDDLEKRLETEAASWEALIRALREKRDALVALRTAEVARLTAAEEALAARLSEAEAARRRAAAESAAVLRLPATATLREIAAASRSPGLAAWREKLAGLLREAARLNDLNRALAAQSLEHVKETLIAMAGASPATYTRRPAAPTPAQGVASLYDGVA